MKLKINPDAGAVVKMLDKADLPTSDITEQLLMHFVGAWSAKKLVGVIGYEPCEELGLLRSLAVSPTAQGRGLGEQLVDAIESLASHNGIEQLYLLTTDAQDYFSRHDFIRVERDLVPLSIKATSQFSSLCPDSATVMKKTL